MQIREFGTVFQTGVSYRHTLDRTSLSSVFSLRAKYIYTHTDMYRNAYKYPHPHAVLCTILETVLFLIFCKDGKA